MVDHAAQPAHPSIDSKNRATRRPHSGSLAPHSPKKTGATSFTDPTLNRQSLSRDSFGLS